MTRDELRTQIEHALPGAAVEVRSEDDVHFAARVVAAQFRGLRTVARHRLVYRALGDAVGREIHALSLETPTPEEWARHGG